MELLRQYPPVTVAFMMGVAGGIVFAAGAALTSPTIGLAALAGVSLILLLLRDPVIGFYLLAALVPIERFGRLTDDTATFEISIMRLLGLLAFVVLIIHKGLRGIPILISPPLVLWIIYTGFAFGSLFYTTDLDGGRQIASGIFGNVLFLVTMCSLVYANSLAEILRRANLGINLWLLASFAICLYSIYDWHFGSGAVGGIPIDSVDPQAGAQTLEYKWSTVWLDTAEKGLSELTLRRSMGSTSHAAVFGINLLMSLPFFIYSIRVSRDIIFRGLMLVGLIASVYCLLLTNTRSVIIIAVPTLGWCMLRSLIPVRAWMILAAAAAGSVALMILPEDIFNRILNIQNYSIENSDALRVRLDYWDAGYRAILDHWFMGVGIGNRKVMLSYLLNPIQGHSTMHNIYLQTALDVGLFGWIFFIGFIVVVLVRTEQLRQRLKFNEFIDAYWLATAAETLMLTVVIFGFQVDVFFFPLKAWWLIASITEALHCYVFRAEASGQRFIGPTFISGRRNPGVIL